MRLITRQAPPALHMDQERFEIGGRDTVILVWSLVLGIVTLFLLLVH